MAGGVEITEWIFYLDPNFVDRGELDQRVARLIETGACLEKMGTRGHAY